jgi:hypothetical protein
MSSGEWPVARVVLRSVRDGSGVRYLDVIRRPDGALEINGQDLGRGVEEAFGKGLTEYEWQWVIEPADVPAAISALGGQDGDDPLNLMVAWIEKHHTDPGNQVRDEGVPTRFWSRIGE